MTPRNPVAVPEASSNMQPLRSGASDMAGTAMNLRMTTSGRRHDGDLAVSQTAWGLTGSPAASVWRESPRLLTATLSRWLVAVKPHCRTGLSHVTESIKFIKSLGNALAFPPDRLTRLRWRDVREDKEPARRD